MTSWVCGHGLVLSSSWGFSQRGGSGPSQRWQQRHDPQLSVMVVLDRDPTSQMVATCVLMPLCSLTLCLVGVKIWMMENMKRKIKWKIPFSTVWLKKENKRDKK